VLPSKLRPTNVLLNFLANFFPLRQVAYIERDTVVYASELERNAPWGLARISHREPLNLRTFSKYNYDVDSGEGVKVYVIDTGINVKHVDFEGRAEWGATIPDGDPDEDGNGHGSHCAGTIAGKRYGVAKKAKPVAVKVLRSNGSGSMSDVVKGVEWATEQHQIDKDAALKANKKYKGAVANMSLGGGKSKALDTAVDGVCICFCYFQFQSFLFIHAFLYPHSLSKKVSSLP
jgi:cerevisin